MQIRFAVDAHEVIFDRNDVSGRAELSFGSGRLELQSPWKFSTHFTFKTVRTWNTRLLGHDILITQTRRQVFGGLRAMNYEIRVDGQLVARRP